MVPRAGGEWEERLWDVLVISHDCEYTKIRGRPTKPLLIAPVRKLSDYSPAQHDGILGNQVHALWPLPQEAPVDDDRYVTDLRLIQPIAVARLEEATFWTCVGPDLKEELQGKLARFLLRKQRV